MTLSVHACRRNETGETEDLTVERTGGGEPSLFGFEVCRTELWGAPCIEELGAVLLPGLAEHDLYVEGAELEVLKSEVENLLANCSTISAATGYREDFIAFRLENFLLAVKRALLEGGVGGVCVL
ncbi:MULTISPECIES: hypothetical protein [unclassified Corallococcus]|uniref:hypothetical protein n=1 Tax=unclassified Corallococcus TaxID=2685029 RepID=UPI001A8E611F|nr:MULTISPECIES: hypothetical protein [unclassified Corallococcus]MBN9682106.1 hypothetical protein [Corallococcus sp. NCSPR001]WAS86333.1 hypothetical protein O0N60_05010 [Corallococcus sp. NCRR]